MITVQGQKTNAPFARRPVSTQVRTMLGGVLHKQIDVMLSGDRHFYGDLHITTYIGGLLKFEFTETLDPVFVYSLPLNDKDRNVIWTQISSIIASQVKANPQIIDVVLGGYVPPHVREKRQQQWETDHSVVSNTPKKGAAITLDKSITIESYVSTPVCFEELVSVREFEALLEGEIGTEKELYLIERDLSKRNELLKVIVVRLNTISATLDEHLLKQSNILSKFDRKLQNEELILLNQQELLAIDIKFLENRKAETQKRLSDITVKSTQIDQSLGFHLSATRRLIEIRKQAQGIRKEAKKSFWKTLRASAATAFISSGMFGVSTGMFFNTVLLGPIGFILGVVFGAAVWIGGGFLQSYANIRKARSDFEKTEEALNAIEGQTETELKARLANIKTEADAFQIIMSVANVSIGLGATFSNPLFVMPGSSAIAIGTNFATFAAIGVVTMTASILLQMYANDESGKLTEAKRRARELSVEYALLQAQIVLEERALQATAGDENGLLEKLKSTHVNLQEMWHEKRKLAAYEHKAEQLRPGFWSRIGHSALVRGLASIIMVDIKPYTPPEELVFLGGQIKVLRERIATRNQNYAADMLAILEIQRQHFNEGTAGRNLLDAEWKKLRDQKIAADAIQPTRDKISNLLDVNTDTKESKEFRAHVADYDRSGKISSIIGGSIVGSTIGIAAGAGIVSLTGIFILSNPFTSIPALIIGGLIGIGFGILLGMKLAKESWQLHRIKAAKLLLKPPPFPEKGSGLATSAANTLINATVMTAAPPIPVPGRGLPSALPEATGVAAGFGFFSVLIGLIVQLFHRKAFSVLDDSVKTITKGIKEKLEEKYTIDKLEVVEPLPKSRQVPSKNSLQSEAGVSPSSPSSAPTDAFLHALEHLPPKHSTNALHEDFTNSPPSTSIELSH